MEKDKKSGFRKKLIIVLIIIASVLLVMYALTVAIPYVQELLEPEETEHIAKFNFFTPDFNENIFEDEEYLAMITDGILEYDDNANSISMVDLSNMSEYGEEVSLLVKMLYSVVNGNSAEYNSYFSQKYFEKKEPKENFTMQKLHNGRITYVGTETVTADGKTYNAHTYTVKYLIYENNGTFRKDIGDTDYRVQYITLSDREGKLLIDSITYPIYK